MREGKHMLQSRVIYIFLLIVVTFYYLLSTSYIAVFLFWFIMCATFLNVIYMFTLKNKIIATLESQSLVEKQSEGTLTIKLKNIYAFPIVYISLTLTIKNKLTNEVSDETFITSLNSFAEKKLPILLKSDYSGVVDVSIKNMYCVDYFQIFKRRMNVKAETSITFVPVLLQGIMSNATAAKELTEAAMFSSEQKGNLNEEMIALKEYVPGDNLKHIHWKLSSKLDELIVKELADVREEHIVILFETSIALKENVQRVKTIDQMMDTFGSVMKHFLEEDKQIHVGWYDDDLEKNHMEELYGMNEMHHVIRLVLNVPVGNYATTTYEQFLQQEQKDAVIFYVTSENDTKNLNTTENVQCIPIYAEQWIKPAEKDEFDYEGVI